jgi:NAD(P)-dependent dehydrogenase (short-subunit alcohol dehydrogenase family)
MYNPFSLEGKTILVTGASSGIGQAIAIECSKMGAKMIITGRNEARLNETFNLLSNDEHLQRVCDLSTEENIKAFVQELPVLDGIVHSAGVARILPFQFTNSKDLKDVFNINCFAPTLLSQMLVKTKKIAKNGSIVFISSVAGSLVVAISHSMYAASKGAITSMARNMAYELAAKKIRVNCIMPGMVETPLIHGGELTQEQLDLDLKFYPLKRYGKPEDIAYAVIYFLSDASAWATGAGLVIDGGFTLS